jgi:COP9 signalosome complex subunit 5
VVDPKRSMSAGKVEIGSFRTFSDEMAEKMKSQGGQKGGAVVSEARKEEFGLHAHKYYKLDTDFFKSPLDTDLLNGLWNEYWMNTLMSSPLINNKDFVNKSINDVVQKLN